jgi:CBS domain-containing protein/sporulation protein YlmC with PRC-barrel domain
MNGPPARVYVARLAGTLVFDPNGDPVGKVRDIVLAIRSETTPPRVLGLVVEVPVRRRIFVPITRVTSIDVGQVITTGVVNMRRFERRPYETLALAELLDRTVTVRATGEQLVVFDLGLESTRTGDWVLAKVAVQRRSNKPFSRRRETRIYEWGEVTGLTSSEGEQGTANLLAALERLRPADVARMLVDLSPKRRLEVASALEDERLADVLEELDPEEQKEILAALDRERAADVLEEMDPDDAADLLSELPPEAAEQFLHLMDPDEAEPVRRLLRYADNSAGGMMTTEPVILGPDATVADALARMRNPDLTPALAALVYVCRPPLETPTGRLLGAAHFQRLLREPPSSLASGCVDTELEPLHPDASLEDVTRMFATYNLVAAPVVDERGRLLGAITVDDVLDHLLGEEWRSQAAEVGS